MTSRIAGYVTRMSGGVGGALSDGRPYPYMWHGRIVNMAVCVSSSRPDLKLQTLIYARCSRFIYTIYSPP